MPKLKLCYFFLENTLKKKYFYRNINEWISFHILHLFFLRLLSDFFMMQLCNSKYYIRHNLMFQKLIYWVRSLIIISHLVENISWRMYHSQDQGFNLKILLYRSAPSQRGSNSTKRLKMVMIIDKLKIAVRLRGTKYIVL